MAGCRFTMHPMTTTNPAHALMWRVLRRVFDGGPPAQRWAVSVIYLALGPLAILMSVVIAGGGGDWLRIAAPKTVLIVVAIVWLAIRSEPRRWEWVVVVGVLPVAAFTVSQLAAGPRASGVFVPNALVVVAVLCVLFDGALVVGVTAMASLGYAVVQFHFHSPVEAAVASLLFVAATAMMVGLVHGAASYLRESFGQVTALHAEMLLAADQERVRIAGELHDDTIQVLVAAAARLDDHSRRLLSGDQEGAIGTAASVREMIGQAVDRTRRLSFDLYPAALEASGLGAALEVLGQDIESQGQFTVTVSVGHRRYPGWSQALSARGGAACLPRGEGAARERAEALAGR
jgi:signal transduction histidine kinase